MNKKHITDIRFDELNKSFYFEYLTFAYGEGLKLNTIGDHIKVIKTVIRDQPMRIQCMAEEFLRCEKLKEESESIALLESEIALIAKQELPTEHLQTVRNMFVLMCWTGVRHSDLEQFNYNSFHQPHYIYTLYIYWFGLTQVYIARIKPNLIVKSQAVLLRYVKL